MRHQRNVKHLNRTSSHRKAMSRNMVSSLFEHGRIETTIQKAKFVRGFAERLITLAKKGDLHSRRRAIALLQDRQIFEDGAKVDTVIGRLFKEIGPRFSERAGGYTRTIKLPYRRIGDNGQMAILELVEQGEQEAAVATVEEAAEVEVEAEAKA